VAGFGITDAEDLLFIRDIAIIRQKVSIVSFLFDDNAVADFFEDQVDAGRKPEQFARILLHTHPGNSPEPSAIDEETFNRVFGACDWSVMAIVAQDNSSYARLRFNVGPAGDIQIPVCVEYGCEFEAANPKQWKTEYKTNVSEIDNRRNRPALDNDILEIGAFGYDELQPRSAVSYEDLLAELDSMEPDERQFFLEELSNRNEFWDQEEMGVFYE
jgi:proteasome lid subunit RPN8/RPN11